jgi:Glycosyl hydrolase family 76
VPTHSTVRRSLVWLTACFAFALSVVACAVFAGGSGDGAVAIPNAARLCAHVYSRAYVWTPVAKQTRIGAARSRRRRDHAECSGAVWQRTGSPPTFGVAASRGIAELVGDGGDHSPVAWDAKRGLWWTDNSFASPYWWQSALELRTLVRYLEHTGNTDPTYQHVILATYQRNILTPHANAGKDFVDKYLDDTAWWGLAWLEAAKYELRYRHDLTDAGTFLRLAEWDGDAVANASKRCGGIEWKLGHPPDTIANAEYAALAAGLYAFRNGPGIFVDAEIAAHWLSQARSTLKWLVRSSLVNMETGTVADKLNSACDKLLGGPMTYTEGEVAEALTQLGTALHDRFYLKQAARFLRYATGPWSGMITDGSGMITGGVLQEPCESWAVMCETRRKRFDLPAYKGILVQAVYDWSVATGSIAYHGFLLAQASSIVNNNISDGDNRAGECRTPHTCQFGFHWALPVVPRASMIGVTAATQAGALDALTAVLPQRLSTLTRPL